MPILKVARLGHPVLRARSKSVPPNWIADPASRRLLQDMVETMHEYEGVGLAAPQIHIPIRVAVIEIAPNTRYPQVEPQPLTVLINPKVLSHAPEIEEDWEGCLSLPTLRGRVARSARIEIEAMGVDGKVRTIRAEGFFARAIQHEIDHLDGKVFLDRMKDLATLTHLEEFRRYHDRSVDKDTGQH